MKSTSECPVCYAVIPDVYTDYLDGWLLCETYEQCPYECYSYEYAHGGSRVHITIRGHHIAFAWSYSSTDFKPRDEAMKIVVEAARRALLEDLRANAANSQTAKR